MFQSSTITTTYTVPVDYKFCPHCQQYKSMDKFNKYHKTKDRKQGWCAECNKVYSRERRAGRGMRKSRRFMAYRQHFIELSRKPGIVLKAYWIDQVLDQLGLIPPKNIDHTDIELSIKFYHEPMEKFCFLSHLKKMLQELVFLGKLEKMPESYYLHGNMSREAWNFMGIDDSEKEENMRRPAKRGIFKRLKQAWGVLWN